MSAPPDADAALVERARYGDREAFRRLVERHQHRAHGLAMRILRSAPDAEEAAQDAFVRAWLALPRFRGESSFATWLHRIVLRRSLDRLAVLRHRARREVVVETEESHEAPGSDPAQRRPGEVEHAMERLVAALPPMQRMVVTMFYYEDQSVERVAEILGMPANTVKTHLFRARSALREAWLESTGGTPE
jgi:RNA polymerase sigma-70 factor (ECF subfamily)